MRPEQILKRLVARDSLAELFARLRVAGEVRELAAIIRLERARLARGALEIGAQGRRIRALIEIGEIPFGQGGGRLILEGLHRERPAWKRKAEAAGNL